MITRKHAKIVGKRERERERAQKMLYSKDHDLYKEKPKFQVENRAWCILLKGATKVTRTHEQDT